MADITTHIQGTYDDINKWNKEDVFKKFMLLTKGLVWCEDIMIGISTFIYDLAQVDIKNANGDKLKEYESKAF